MKLFFRNAKTISFLILGLSVLGCDSDDPMEIVEEEVIPCSGENELTINGAFETGDKTGWLFFDKSTSNGGTVALIDTDFSCGTHSASVTSGKFNNPGIKQERFGVGVVTANQNINVPNINDADFLVLKKIENKVVIQMNIIRNGSSYGSKAYFPNVGKNAVDVNDNEIMQAFICQFYDKNVPATNILVNQNPKDKTLIEELLSKKHDIKVKIDLPQRGKKLEIINSALKNAAENLNRKIFEKTSNKNNLIKIKTIFRFENDLNKIEIYDNSHHQGKSPIGAMVAFNEDGFSKSLYRRYNINLEYNKNSNNKTEVHNNNNDYLMMEEVIKRRFKGKNIINFPDLLIIDGGKGHLNTVLSVLKKIKVEGVEVLAISKGLDRDAGRENFYTKNMNNFKFNKDDPTLFFLQNLRDEVHRYAIAGHRLKSKKALLKSPLDEIVGIGANRKKSLLEEFGSAKAVGSASLEDLLKVDGINKSIAENIFNFFN